MPCDVDFAVLCCPALRSRARLLLARQILQAIISPSKECDLPKIACSRRFTLCVVTLQPAGQPGRLGGVLDPPDMVVVQQEPRQAVRLKCRAAALLCVVAALCVVAWLVSWTPARGLCVPFGSHLL